VLRIARRGGGGVSGGAAFPPVTSAGAAAAAAVTEVTSAAPPPPGQKFLTHQFTFLDPPIFFALKLILPTTSLKPAFLTHQCLCTSLEPPISGKDTYSRLNFSEGHIPLSKSCKEREAPRGEQTEPCPRRVPLFIGGKGSTRLCCTHSPDTHTHTQTPALSLGCLPPPPPTTPPFLLPDPAAPLAPVASSSPSSPSFPVRVYI
jgi:hypothetical protein